MPGAAAGSPAGTTLRLGVEWPGTMYEYLSETVIAAPPDVVWRVLTDAGAYAQWKPEVVAVEGHFAERSAMVWRHGIPGGATR